MTYRVDVAKLRPHPGLAARDTGTSKGAALYTTQQFVKGALVLPFDGPIVPQDAPIPKYQIGASTFMGPDGTAADALNHSCDPSIWINPGKPGKGYALRDLAVGEEVTLDYSLTHTAATTFFTCLCGAINCRKTISGFGSIPGWQQERYIQLGVVPQYVLDHFLPELLSSR